jgi:hypothetical protein
MDDDIHFLASKLSRISRSRDDKAAFVLLAASSNLLERTHPNYKQ